MTDEFGPEDVTSDGSESLPGGGARGDAAADNDRVKSILFEASRLKPEEIEAYLDVVCGDDAALRAKVQGLLPHVGRRMRSGSASQAETSIEATVSDPSLPERIGKYRVQRRIGEGGMGIVYRAVQESPRRIVALKVIRPQLVTEQAIRRFRLEAETLGRLQHPGIAQLYEAGVAETDAGEQPFFAMEFIKGKPLLDYVKATQLDIRGRLELVCRVIDAVQHAHSRGVVHRDLKPANILVTEQGDPKILDFGVARTTGVDLQVTTVYTQAGQLIGTLPYMSPEQVSGDPDAIDTRSDVYSLGVIIYELLAGKMPYDIQKAALIEAIRVIQEVEPSSLSDFDRAFRGDIETIVSKALEKMVERRYASASELAGDIRRYLRDEPISARPPSAAYQIYKFAKRHRAISGVAIASVVGLVVSVAGLSYGVVQRGRANTALAASNERLSALLLLTGSLRDAAEASRRTVGGSAAARVLAENVLGVLDGMGPGEGVSAEVINESLSLANTAGESALYAGTAEAARGLFERAEAIAGSMVGSAGGAGNGVEAERVRATIGRGRAMVLLGDVSGANLVFSAARDRLGSVDDAGQREALRGGIALARADAMVRTSERFAEAGDVLRAAESAMTAAGGESFVSAASLAEVRIALATWHEQRMDLDTARAMFERAAAGLEAAGAAGSDDWVAKCSMASAWEGSGRVAHRVGTSASLAEAGEAYGRSRAVLERVHLDDPGNDVVYRDLCRAVERLGDIAWQTGDGAAGRALYSAFRELAGRARAMDPSDLYRRRGVALADERLAEVDLGADPAAALAATDGALAVYETLAAADPANADFAWDVPRARFIRGNALWEMAGAANGDERMAFAADAVTAWIEAALGFEALYVRGALTPARVPYMARAMRNAARFSATDRFVDSPDPMRSVRWYELADRVEPRREWRLPMRLASVYAAAGMDVEAEGALLRALAWLDEGAPTAEDRDRLRDTFESLGVAWPGGDDR